MGGGASTAHVTDGQGPTAHVTDGQGPKMHIACIISATDRPYQDAANMHTAARIVSATDRPYQDAVPVIEDTKRPEPVPMVPPDKPTDYDLVHPEGLVQFLRQANVALVWGKFLSHLIQQKRTLPRRQEAEMEDGALVTDKELEEWPTKQRPLIWSISHCWESREHADPFGFQINRLKEGFEKTPGLGLDIFESSWFFYDYISLYQYKRESHLQGSFDKAMANMHVLYTHECTRTISIQKLTPETWMDPERCIPSYNDETGQVESRPIKALKKNPTPYHKRGWCQAELLWSSSRSQILHLPELKLRISGCTSDIELLEGETGIGSSQRSEVPVPPSLFEQRAQQLEFTHRSDMEPVLILQAKVFHLKAASSKTLSVGGTRMLPLDASDVETLSEALPHYNILESVSLAHFEIKDSTAFSLAKSLLQVSDLSSVRLTDCVGPCPQLGSCMAEVLRGKSLKHLDLTGCKLTAAGGEVLAQALKDNRTVEELILMDQGDLGSKALAEAICKSSVRNLQLYGTSFSLEAIQVLSNARQLHVLGFGPRYHSGPLPGAWCLRELKDELTAAVEALANAMETGELREIDLSFSGLDDPHAQRVAQALKKNPNVSLLDLRNAESFSEETAKELLSAWGDRPSENLLLP